MHGGSVWTPHRLIWSGLFMAWAEPKEAVERFRVVETFLRTIRPAFNWPRD